METQPDRLSDHSASPPAPLVSQYREDENVWSLIPFFLKSLRENLTTLEGALAQAEWPVVAKVAHKVKGSSACYGYPEVASVALRLERLAKEEPNALDARAILDELVTMAERVNLGLSCGA